MKLPEQVIFAMERIQTAKGQAWLVGGAVRDMLLGRPVQDYDLATTLSPDIIERLFSDCNPYTAGKRFGTICVLIGGKTIEITTLRGEDSYTDSRHPDRVYFISDIETDLARRDSTINAIAYNPFSLDGIIDPFNGRQDLSEGVIRTVREPTERFNEDPLRMLRAIRLAAQLDFKIDENTKNTIAELHSLLDKVAFERINDELSKLLLSPHPATGLILLKTTGVINVILPCSDRVALSPGQLEIIAGIEPVLAVRLAALIFYLYPDKNEAEISRMLKNLRYSNAEAAHAARLIHGFKYLTEYEPAPYNIRRLLAELGEKDMYSLIGWYMAAAKAENNQIMQSRCNRIRRLYNIILQNKDPVDLKDLAVTGNDIINTGIGKLRPEQIGEALRTAHDWVLHNPELNDRQYLLYELKKIYNV